MTLYTSSWTTLYRAERERGDGEATYPESSTLPVRPVRISISFPRFWAGSVVFPSMEILVPRGIAHRGLSPEEFERRYMDRLEQIGPRRIEEAIIELEAETDRPLCFCCFEVDPSDCHRSQFARFMREQAGLLIGEWEPARAQLTLGDQDANA